MTRKTASWKDELSPEQIEAFAVRILIGVFSGLGLGIYIGGIL